MEWERTPRGILHWRKYREAPPADVEVLMGRAWQVTGQVWCVYSQLPTSIDLNVHVCDSNLNLHTRHLRIFLHCGF